MTDALVTFDHVRFGYSARGPVVLPDLCLEIAPGSVTAILGPNGGGKTTLLHLLLGWLRPQAGEILLEGKPLGAYARNELGRRMALVPQRESVAFDYTVVEHALFGRTPYLRPLEMPGARDFAVAREAVERVGLGPLADRSIGALSGGERQLTLVARALAQRPRLLLLDEPTSHLDLGNKARLVEIFKRLNADGVTIVFTTHEPDVASALATDLILMGRGAVQCVGALAEVLTAANLSALYGLQVDVVEAAERRLIVWN